MTLFDLRDALLEVLDDVYHFIAPERKPEHYILWGETGGADSVKSDDAPDTIAIRGRLYYYTSDEYDVIFDDICQSLTDHGIAWKIGNIGYDDTLRQIIYEVTWEVICGSCSVYKQ